MRIGIMQGRLSPPQGEALQFFPKDWKAEFAIARDLGFETIEWIFDKPIEQNPLMGESGISDMKALSRQSGVLLDSVCADVFVKKHLTGRDSATNAVLSDLIENAALSGIRIVNIPFVESHVPVTDKEIRSVITNVVDVVRRDESEVELALEMDMMSSDIISIVDEVDSPRVGVCYDTGNAMTFGFDAGADIRKLGDRLKEIHIKDRLTFTRRSVYLGEGSVDFPDVFDALGEVGFDGLCILQAWRGKNYLEDAKRQLEFVKQFLK